MENEQDPWAAYPIVGNANTQNTQQADDPWAAFPIVETTPQDEAAMLNVASGRTAEGRQIGGDMAGVPTGLDSGDVQAMHQPTAPTVADKPLPSYVNNDQFSENVRTVGNIIANPVGSAMDAMFPSFKESRDAVREKYKDRTSKIGIGPVGFEVGIGNADHSRLGDILGSGFNAARNAIQSPLVVGDIANGDNRADDYDRFVPQYKALKGDDIGEGIVTGGEFAAGMIGTYPLLSGALKNSGRVTKIVAGLLGESAAAGATVSSDAGTLVFGDNAALKGQIGERSVGEAMGYEGVAKAKLDIMADTLLTATVASPVIAGVVKAGGLANDLLLSRLIKRYSQAGKEDAAVRGILSDLANLTGEETDEQVQSIFNGILQKINDPKNKDLYDALTSKLTNEEWDSMSEPVRERLKTILMTEDEMGNMVPRTRDTMSAYEASLPAEKDRSVADSAAVDRARSIREGALRSGASNTQAKLSQPSSILRSELDYQFGEAGGREAAEEAAETVQRSANEQALGLDLQVALEKDAVDAISDNANKVLADDPVIGREMRDLGGDVDININRRRNQARNQIGQGIENAKIAQDEELGRLASQIDPETAIDYEKLDILTQREDFAPVLDELSPEVRRIIEDPKSTFADLFDTVPELTRTIDSKFGSGQDGMAHKLTELRDIINSPLGDAPSVQEFKNYYKNVWADNWRDDPLEQYSNLYKKSKGRADEAGNFPKDTKYKQGLEDTVTRGLSTPEYAAKIDKLIRSPESGVPANVVGDAYIGEALAPIQRAINEKGVFEPEDIGKVLSVLEENGPQIERVAPELYSRINEFATNLRNRNLDLAKARTQLEELTKNAEEAKKAIYNKELKPFFEDVGDGKVGVQGAGLNIFDTLFNDPKGANRLDKVIARIEASDNPVAKEGLQAAYLNSVKKRVFGSGQDSTGAAAVNKNFQRKEAQNDTNLRLFGDKVFKDKPGFTTMLGSVIEEASNAAGARTSTSMKQLTGKEIDEQSKGAFDMLVTFMFGPLSRTGSKVRSQYETKDRT